MEASTFSFALGTKGREGEQRQEESLTVREVEPTGKHIAFEGSSGDVVLVGPEELPSKIHPERSGYQVDVALRGAWAPHGRYPPQPCRGRPLSRACQPAECATEAGSAQDCAWGNPRRLDGLGLHDRQLGDRGTAATSETLNQ